MRMSKGLVVVLCSSWLLFACTPNSPESFSKEAQDLRESGDIAAELVVLKSAVESFPDNATLRILLGDSNFRTGNGVQAITEYENAFELDSSVINADLLQRIMRIMYVQEMSDETFEFLKLINRPQLVPQQQAFYKAAAYHRLGDRDKALALLDQLTTQSGAISSLSAAYSEVLLGNPRSAVPFLEDALYAQQDLLEARFLLADIFYLEGQYREAASVFEAIIEYPIKSIYARYRLAKIYLVLDQEERAQVMIDGLETAFPDIPEISELKAELEFKRENYIGAKQFADQAAAKDYRSDDLLYIMGVSNYYLQTYEQALRPLLSVQPSSNRYESAQNFITVLELLIEGPKINLLDTNIARKQISASYELAKLGHIRPAQQMLQLIDSQQANIDIKAYLNLLNYALDPTEEKFEALRQASLSPDTNPITKIMFIEAEIEKGSDDEQVITTALTAYQDGKRAEVIIVTNKMLQARDRRGAGKRLLEQALEIQKDAPRLLTEYISLHISANDLNKASELVLANKNAEGFEARARAFAAELINKGVESEALETLVGNAYEEGNTSLSTAIYYASIQGDDPQRVIEILAPFSKQDNLNSAYYFLLYRAYLRTGQIEPTLDLTKDWVRMDPSFQAYQYRITSLDISREYDLVLRELNKMERLFGKNEYTKLMRVNYYLALNRVDDAKKYWALLPASITNSLPGNEVEARILYLENQFLPALTLLKNVQSANSLSEQGFGTLLGTLGALRDRDGLAEALEERLKSQPFNQRLRLLLIDLLSQAQNPEVIKHLEFLLEQAPSSAVVQNNLAWAYFQHGENEKALSLAKSLNGMNIQQAEILHTIGMIMVSLGDKQVGIQALRQASELSDNPQFESDYKKHSGNSI